MLDDPQMLWVNLPVVKYNLSMLSVYVKTNATGELKCNDSPGVQYCAIKAMEAMINLN